MKTSDFYYDLPKELIAQSPMENRASSRLLVYDRSKKTIEDRVFSDIIDYLRPGDVLVRNDTRVIPALFTRMSIEPKSAWICFTVFSVSAKSAALPA